MGDHLDLDQALLDDGIKTTVKWHVGVAIRDPEMAARLTNCAKVETPDDGFLHLGKIRGALAAWTGAAASPAVKTATQAAMEAADAKHKAEEARRNVGQMERRAFADLYQQQPVVAPQPPPAGLMRERGDNPFELDQRQMAGGEPDLGWQVWCGGEMIGWLKISDNHIRGGAVEIPVFEAPPLPVLSKPEDYLLAPMTTNIRTIRLNIKRRAVRLDNYQVNMAFDEEELKREFRKTHQIPASAEMIRDHATDSYEFRWRVLETSLNASEQIFDMDQFTPNPDQR